MRSIFLPIIAICLFSSCQIAPDKKPVEYVNPMTGTSNGGNTFPSASVPWGMVKASPHNSREELWSGSRYYHGNSFIYGFAQLQMSGVGCADFGNLNVMPTQGRLFVDYHKNRSRYTNETAKPEYYAVDLTKHDIRTEITATRRSSLYRFSFSDTREPSNIIIDVTEGLSECRDSYVEISGADEIRGWIKAGGFCFRDNEYTIHFAARFDQAAKSSGTWNNLNPMPDKKQQSGQETGAWFSFENTKEVQMKIGLSFVSMENALLNLETEQPGWDFNGVREKAREEWNNQLSKIAVQSEDEDNKTIFYTALYHALQHPNIINDVNGEYPAMHSHETKNTGGERDQYTVYSLWDTYRSLHPLLTLVYPQQQTDMLATMADMADETGYLPFWELGADESYVMNGDPAALVITDSYMKGLRDFDVATAYDAMLRTALTGEGNPIRPLNEYFIKHDFIPWDDCGPDDEWGKPRMVSECLEYALGDWATAQLAKEFNNDSIYNLLSERSKAYKHYFDTTMNFVRPRYSNGEWYEPFSPEAPHGSWHNPGFVEGNSWQYTYLAPHDVEGLIEITGGEKPFVNKVREYFDGEHYAIDNEPAIHYPYLFTYVDGEAHNTQEIIRYLMDYHFNTKHNGLPGNDDAGTISAWYIFSSMGFYPVCPGKTDYRLGSPVFDRIEIQLDSTYYSGNKFVIEAIANGPESVFVEKMQLNGEEWSRSYIQHQDIVEGGHLKMQMTSTHGKSD